MPDIKPQVYKDDRPAEYFDQFHVAARKGVGWTYPFVRAIVSLPTLLIYRVRAIGVKNVPKSGPLILAPNHFSQMDHFFCGLYLRRQIRFMAKSQLFGSPVLTYIYKHGGVIPVRRGHHDEEAFVTAYTVLGQGGMLLIYAEGGRSRSGELGEPKPGVGRLALESGAPVVPVAIHGSSKVRRWKRFRFPKVTIQYGEPVSFPVEESPSRERQLEVATEVFGEVRRMHGELATRSGSRAGRRTPGRGPG
ncbi:MAG TPA: lysophospholipid acyltransferase family protein [Solirubrobacterales bacterium]|nr:lysophospholipid acyltransferase family protein [Solirubrobacterales bacterium]